MIYTGEWNTWRDLPEKKKDPYKKKYFRGSSPTRRTDEQARRNRRVRKAKAARKARNAARG